jgi:predicted RNase H-like HicB family nuclease
MARADAGDQDSPRREIRLVKDDDGRWSAIDEVVGVASQGETRSEALAAVDEAVGLYTGEIGDPLRDADLRELGFDPNTIPDEPQEPDAPWFSPSQ